MEKEIVFNKIEYQISDEGKKIPLYSNSKSPIQVWENYIKAHNVKDTVAIRKLNAVGNFNVYTPTGELIEGTDAHISFLVKWFTKIIRNGLRSIWSPMSIQMKMENYINGSPRDLILLYL